MKSIYTITLCLFFAVGLWGQGKGGASLYGGITQAVSQDKTYTPDGYKQSGYHLGLDARLFGGTMYFGGGLEYHVLTLIPLEKNQYFGPEEKLSMIKTRFGLGFYVYRFTRSVYLRAKAYGTFNFNAAYDSDKIDYELVGTHAGAIGGIGLDIGAITFDFDYEHGLINAISERPDTKMNFYKFSVGFFF